MISQYQYPTETLNPTFADWNRMNPVGPYAAGAAWHDPYIGEGNSAQWNEPLMSQDQQTRYQSLPDWEQAYLRQPLTNDQYSLLLNKKVADTAKQVRLRADIANAQRNLSLLNSVGQGANTLQQLGQYPVQQTAFSPDQMTLAGRGMGPTQPTVQQLMSLRQPPSLASVYAAPTNPQEAQLQDILNRDYAGRELGSKLSMQGILYNEALNRKLAQERFDNLLKLGAYNESVSRDKANQALANQNLNLRTSNAGNLNDYRNSRLDQIDQAQIDRTAGQSANRAIQQQSLELRKKMAEASTANTEFGNWVRALKSGAPADQLQSALAAMPSLSESDQQVAGALLQNRANQGVVAESLAQQYQNMMSHATAGLTDANQIKMTIDSVARMINKDPVAKNQIYYDPTLRRVVPVQGLRNVQSPAGSAPSYSTAAASGSNFSDSAGSSYPETVGPALPDGNYKDAQGNAYRVVNGQQQPMNLRLPTVRNTPNAQTYAPSVPVGISAADAARDYFGNGLGASSYSNGVPRIAPSISGLEQFSSQPSTGLRIYRDQTPTFNYPGFDPTLDNVPMASDYPIGVSVGPYQGPPRPVVHSTPPPPPEQAQPWFNPQMYSDWAPVYGPSLNAWQAQNQLIQNTYDLRKRIPAWQYLFNRENMLTQ